MKLWHVSMNYEVSSTKVKKCPHIREYRSLWPGSFCVLQHKCHLRGSVLCEGSMINHKGKTGKYFVYIYMRAKYQRNNDDDTRRTIHDYKGLFGIYT